LMQLRQSGVSRLVELCSLDGACVDSSCRRHQYFEGRDMTRFITQ
jgi:hypothetical protein